MIDSKQPQFLVDIVSESLTPSRYVLTNNVGIAGGLSWELKRSDIILFDKQGELKYGLSWPDAQHQFVDQAHFADWLATHRQQATRPSKSGRRGRHILGWLGLALLALGCSMLLWLSVLQSIPVSIAYPMLSLNFVWVTLAAWGIWREPVARRHWLGVGLIVVGIVILGSRI